MNLDSFSTRVALLLGLMAIAAAVDLYHNGAQAVRCREYGFILVAGALGAAFGFVNDLITSSISPEFFILGKGLEDVPDLRIRAALFGLRVGFSAGVIGGAICLFATRRKSAQPPVKFSRLLQLLWMPVAGAILCGILAPLAFSSFDPARLSAQLNDWVDPEKITHFRQVWWIHVGLYAGLALGLAAMITRALRERR